ncbi:MAG: universal stress protein [Syntrophaceae bacterium]|nr:universal stress protein [Syntrophaceae bacterium]
MIPRIKNILYATDLSKNSAYAFRYAINSAQKHDAKIHIIHAIETLSSATEGLLLAYLDPGELERIKQEKRNTLIEKIRNRLNEFARRELAEDPDTLKKIASILVTFGDPAEEILCKADELNADVVIMGTHGKGIIRHSFLGSVSERVLHRIRKPVYIIPLPEGETDITLGEI